jgi:hypothetical protein
VQSRHRSEDVEIFSRSVAPMGPSRLRVKKPLICAVSGYAVAGGLELSLLGDIRIVEEDAVFGVFCRRWGVRLLRCGSELLLLNLRIGPSNRRRHCTTASDCRPRKIIGHDLDRASCWCTRSLVDGAREPYCAKRQGSARGCRACRTALEVPTEMYELRSEFCLSCLL